MDRYCNRPDMYTEDQKMWSDYDDRNGYYLSGGKFVLEKCDCQTPALRSRQQCHIEDPVSLLIFFSFGTQLQWIRRCSDDLLLLSQSGTLKSAHGGTYCIFQTLLLRSLPDGYPGWNLIGNAGCTIGGLACEALGELGGCAVCIERR